MQNDMRDRLVDLLDKAFLESNDNYGMPCTDQVADHLIANGVIVPPCKVGEMIYLPWKFDGVKSIACLTVTHIIFDREHNFVKTDFHTDDEAYYDKYKCGSYEFEDFGKTLFLTKDQAEQKLKEMRVENE